MKVFHCDHCHNLAFFENTQCTRCHRLLAYLPDLKAMASLDQGQDDTWTSPWAQAKGRAYHLCQNYNSMGICNWAVPVEDPNPLCASCRLTLVIPNLSRPGSIERWQRLEAAKRRLLYGLTQLSLPLKSRTQDPNEGLEFQFCSDEDTPDDKPALTGHDGGVITVNIAEADDSERERRRVQLHEPYRTLLGHFRHEIGHYYWDRLVRDSVQIEPFRALFGDERADYAQALKDHYSSGGPPADWQQRFVSAYAAVHPWEDWAETWAHYLHIADTLETAAACGLSLQPAHDNEPALAHIALQSADRAVDFDRLITDWFPVAYVLNSLNRGMGLPDAYPFVLSAPAIEKLRFVHDVIAAAPVEATPVSQPGAGPAAVVDAAAPPAAEAAAAAATPPPPAPATRQAERAAAN